jgi:hypothetical protein
VIYSSRAKLQGWIVRVTVDDIELDLDVIERYYLLGADHGVVAEWLGLSSQKWAGLRQHHPAIRDAVLRGSAPADAAVVSAFFKTCTGYSARRAKVVSTAEGPLVVEYTDYVGPDGKSCIEWLRRRQPRIWGDRAAMQESTDAAHYIDQIQRRFATGDDGGATSTVVEFPKPKRG